MCLLAIQLTICCMAVKVHIKEITSHGREVARRTGFLLVARTLRFPLGGFLAFPELNQRWGIRTIDF